MKTSLVILAAGMGSRYGGLKQLDQIGPGGETILDYSVYDAIRAGFDKIVFVIRDEFADDFQKAICDNIPEEIKVVLVNQGLDVGVPEGMDTSHREKPRGTAHAVLCTKDVIHEPFAVINADDYYGVSSFETMYKFLNEEADNSTCSIIGYILKNTLSDHGSVNRGVCRIEDGYLTNITECLGIERKGDILVDQEGREFDGSELVSMNFFGFHDSYLDYLSGQFLKFLEAHGSHPKKEFYIPNTCSQLIESSLLKCKVFPSQDRWFGVSYRQDKPYVQGSINNLVEQGIYPSKLWSE